MHLKSKKLLEIHIAVFLFGLAGLFGKLLTFSPLVIVFGRVVFASIALLVLAICMGQSLRLRSIKTTMQFIVLGIILAVHWAAFFQSVQVSTVAIGLITFSTFPIFVAFMEPWMSRQTLQAKDILLAVVALCGIIILIPSFEWGNNITQGILWGIASGFSFALLSVLNRRYVQTHASITIALYQDVFAGLALLPFVWNRWPSFTSQDFFLLFILGVLCTALAHTLFISGMKQIRARTASMIACLEPFYGVLVGVLLLQEYPNIRTIIGGLIIVGVAFYATVADRDS
ncbi:MAG TPA: DMT family transporter [Candidatus Peribacteraceae bacterium]|nr:DMT family transporter [Candidatus Peribacteraceae bacterium]